MKEMSIKIPQDIFEKMIQRDQEKKNDIPRDYYDITRKLLSFELPGKCPFKVGDFVTPKKETIIKNPGEPCLVMTAYESCQLQPGERGAPLYLYNMIIARVDFYKAEEFLLFLANSGDYELYTGLRYGDTGELEEPGV